MAASYTPCLSKTIAAAVALSAQRFVGFDGNYPAAGEAAYGATLTDADVGDQVNVTVLGTAALEAGEAIALGAEVEVGADGKAMSRVNGASSGRALSAAAQDGDRIEVLLLHAGDSSDLAAAEAAIQALEAHAAGDGTDHGAVAQLVADLAGIEVDLDPSTEDALGVKRVAHATFDATGGLAVGAHLFGPELPDNATLLRTWYEVITTFTSAADGATVALGIDTDDAGGIVAAVAISDGGNPWDAGLHEGIQDGTVANASAKTAAAGRQFVADVGVEPLTAGKLRLYAEYFVSE